MVQFGKGLSLTNQVVRPSDNQYFEIITICNSSVSQYFKFSHYLYHCSDIATYCF